MDALLEWAERQISQPPIAQPEPAQAIPELAKTLSWLTARIETLEAETTALKAERDQMAAQLNSPQAQRQIAQLQAENTQLKAQLNHSNIALESIRAFITSGSESSSPVSAPTVSPAPSPMSPAIPLAIPLAISPEPAGSASRSTGSETPKRHRLDSGGTTAKIHQIIDAILSWNSAQDDSESMLRISIPIVKTIGVAMGATYQQAIQLVLKEREAELEAFHSLHLLGVRHNASVMGRETILQTIARDYLGLDNWQQIKAV